MTNDDERTDDRRTLLIWLDHCDAREASAPSTLTDRDYDLRESRRYETGQYDCDDDTQRERARAEIERI
jgi:hypothetical protein